MIDMGLVNGNCGMGNDCQGIVIEHLGLNAGGINNLNGIVNLLGEELTYVDDVALTGFAGTGTGLTLGSYSGTGGGAATNSGPYSNIYFYSSGGTCLRIQGTVMHPCRTGQDHRL